MEDRFSSKALMRLFDAEMPKQRRDLREAFSNGMPVRFALPPEFPPFLVSVEENSVETRMDIAEFKARRLQNGHFAILARQDGADDWMYLADR